MEGFAWADSHSGKIFCHLNRPPFDNHYIGDHHLAAIQQANVIFNYSVYGIYDSCSKVVLGSPR